MRPVALLLSTLLAAASASAHGCGSSSRSEVASTGSTGGSGTGAAGSSVVPSACTLGVKVALTMTEDPLMDPGMACIECHTATFGPTHLVAGTVFWSTHEPDLCPGVDGTAGEAAGIQVVVVDATGDVSVIPVREDGNFYASSPKSVGEPVGLG